MAVLSGKARPAAAHRGAGWAQLPTGVRYTIVVAALVGLWQIYVQATHISPLLVASPVQV